MWRQALYKKPHLEETEAAVDVFKERLNKMDTTFLEANQEKSQTIAMHQEVPQEEATVEIVRAED